MNSRDLPLAGSAVRPEQGTRFQQWARRQLLQRLIAIEWGAMTIVEDGGRLELGTSRRAGQPHPAVIVHDPRLFSALLRAYQAKS